MAMPHEKIRYWSLVKDLEDQLHIIRNAPDTLDDLSDTRNVLTAKLHDIHEHINSFLLDRDAYFALFALTAYCDEVIFRKTSSTNVMWSSLQMHLFNVSNAGDVYFDIINSFRGRYDIPGIVYETYMLTLVLGFEGRYAGSASSIQRYKDELSSFIKKEVVNQEGSTMEIKRKSSFRIPAIAYYSFMVLLILLINRALQASADGYMANL